MSEVRKHIRTLPTGDLWNIFAETVVYEKTGVVPEDAMLRSIATTIMANTIMAMMVVATEVFRELAVRGSHNSML